MAAGCAWQRITVHPWRRLQCLSRLVARRQQDRLLRGARRSGQRLHQAEERLRRGESRVPSARQRLSLGLVTRWPIHRYERNRSENENRYLDCANVRGSKAVCLSEYPIQRNVCQSLSERAMVGLRV